MPKSPSPNPYHGSVTTWLEEFVPDANVADQALAVAGHAAATRLHGTPGQPSLAPIAIQTLEVGDGRSYATLCLLASVPHDIVGDHPGLLVALPEFNTCALLDPHGFHVPSYLREKLRDSVPASGIAILAGFTTHLSWYLEQLHAASLTPS
jgi:hypothetical protein